ncbi:MAG: FAD-binding oxidoreductase [Chloroflexi bacterium]|nr:FAD-binding oxidoreductase [Chloroflexota bacterium]
MAEASQSETGFEVDGLSPSRVERPASADELSRVIADANSAGEAVIPWGGGTRMSLGNTPERYDVAVDLTGISGIVEYEPADLTVVVSGGTRIAELQAVLGESGQRLDFDPPEPAAATIGGSLASNAVGPVRSNVGGVRDLAIGLEVVEADGAVTKSGGRVVKNVQGFDLVRLHIGALGTLGIITEVAFKVSPIPADTQTVAGWFDGLDAARETAMRIFNWSFQPEALAVLVGARALAVVQTLAGPGDGESEAVVILARVSGGFSAVRRQVDELTSLFGADMADGFDVLGGQDAEAAWAGSLPDAQTPPALSARATLKPTDAFAYASRLIGASNAVGAFGATIHVGTGTVLADWPGGDPEELAKTAAAAAMAAREFRCEAVFERYPSELKSEIDVWGNPGPAIDIMRRMKEQFDPKRTLNPGRFVGRI